MKLKYLLLIIPLFFTGCAKNQPSVILLEAESFDKKGGWVTDQQFMDQMGSPYLRLCQDLELGIAVDS